VGPNSSLMVAEVVDCSALYRNDGFPQNKNRRRKSGRLRSPRTGLLIYAGIQRPDRRKAPSCQVTAKTNGAKFRMVIGSKSSLVIYFGIPIRRTPSRTPSAGATIGATKPLFIDDQSVPTRVLRVAYLESKVSPSWSANFHGARLRRQKPENGPRSVV
jgi:hypothetical protein